MKHLFKFLSFAAIAAMTAISCNKEIETPDVGTDAACPEGYYVEELTAVYPRDPETRTAFNETTGRFAWTEGDQLAFHLSNGEYVAASIDPATSKVKLYLPVGVTRDNYAVYPASAVVDDAATVGNMKVTLPDSYDISANPNTDFVPTPLVAWNDAENNHLKFEHVGGLLQVNLKVPAGVKTATVSMGKTITGTFSLEDGTGNGIIAPGTESSEGITFVLSQSGLTEETQVKLLAPLPTGTYEHFEVSYDNGFAFSRDLSANPWNFTRSGGKKVSIAEDKFEDMTDYFWIEAVEAESTVSMFLYAGRLVQNYKLANFVDEDKGFYYSIDNKQTWNHYNMTANEDNESITLHKKGDRVYFRSTSNYSTDHVGIPGATISLTSPYYYYPYFKGTGSLKAGGNIMTLKNYKSIPETGRFGYLFNNLTCLVDASEVKMPSKTSQGCFVFMFNGCTSLKEGPKLPNHTSYYAYKGMYKDCSSLVVTPELPNGSYAPSGVYDNMFNGCTSLVTAPQLPATELGAECYREMFRGCTSLKNVQAVLPANEISWMAYYFMFANCSSLEVAPEMYITKVTGNQACSAMFLNCSSLTTPPSVLASVGGILCYSAMFSGCTSLTYGPELPATELSGNCYSSMFYGCSSLIKAPDLPATKLDESCYAMMFYGCSSLENAPELPAKELPHCCYQEMFRNCKSLVYLKVGFDEWPPKSDSGTAEPDGAQTLYWMSGAKNTSDCKFYLPSTATVKRGTSFIPSKWTVVNF